MSDDDDYEDDPDDDELPAPLAIDLPAYNTAVNKKQDETEDAPVVGKRKRTPSAKTLMIDDDDDDIRPIKRSKKPSKARAKIPAAPAPVKPPRPQAPPPLPRAQPAALPVKPPLPRAPPPMQQVAPAAAIDLDDDTTDNTTFFGDFPFKSKAPRKHHTGGRQKTFRQVIAMERDRCRELKINQANYLSIEAPPSLLPAKHYCDISGLQAHYTDPTSKLRYHSVYEYVTIKTLNPHDIVRLLQLRGAGVSVVD